jgi:flavin reductase (DIM6/NTAB) family NADH-FMN oxidoreductase RutF
MTISSFSTVSLNPYPIISFNIKTPSSTYTAITSSKKFIIHTLSASRAAMRIASHFSRGLGAENFVDPEDGSPLPFVVTKIPGMEDDKTEPPLLVSNELVNPVLGTIPMPYAFKCEYEGQHIVVSDHVILTAKIVQVLHTPRGPNLDFGRPYGKQVIGLSYADGMYRRPGRGVNPNEKQSAADGERGNKIGRLEVVLRNLRDLVDPGKELGRGELAERITGLMGEAARERARRAGVLREKEIERLEKRGGKTEGKKGMGQDDTD